MKNKYVLITVLLLFFAKSFSQEKTIKNADPYIEKLKSINNELADAFVNENIDVVMKYYDDKEPTCMPEYHKALYTKHGIQYYYQQWFNSVEIKSYKRAIYEVQRIKNHLVEIGTFVNNFMKPNNILFNYEGKYMNVWRIEKNGNLTLISEIWGANTAVDKSNFSFIEQQASVMPKLRVSKTISDEIGKRNDLIAKLVKKRQGEKHATELFTKDAIYMTYDTPMLIGMDNIKPYFTEHEKPNDVSIDFLEIKPSTMINLDNFVIEYGYYYVEVSWDNKKGKATVTGKSTNLWKRDKNGVWMLYRQMVNHD
ncbi:nuclear transport factor 2 family protein [Flavobacterium sp. N1736]|uniref:nuclear transport factor 2 family protein n=1 Tax=Flavobacterium sp. N1736 TaxID=2986823 RepID=UPI0022259542|nr:nuclear transport factor 2 family protein [Flavobacterium sp. N1736]